MPPLRLFLKVLISEPPHLQQHEAKPEASVESVLAAVRSEEPAAHLALVLEGAELPRARALAACGVSDGATLHVICTRRTLRLRTDADGARPQPPPLVTRLERGGGDATRSAAGR
eukprot:4385774-Prymnesium_polylepis.1